MRWLCVLLSLAACTGRDTDDTDTDVDGPSPIYETARSIGGCEVFPRDFVFNTPIRDLPVHEDSPTWLAFVDDSVSGAGLTIAACADGSCGVPLNVVDSDVTLTTEVVFNGPDVFDRVSFPLPESPAVDASASHRLVILDTRRCRLHELRNYRVNVDTKLADGAASWVMSRSEYADADWGGGERAGLPMLAGLFDHDEVAAGGVSHALRLAMPRVRDTAVWPAIRSDGRTSDIAAPSMGSRLRLRADYPTDGLEPQAAALATALKDYGAIVAGSSASGLLLEGVPDAAWSADDLGALAAITTADLDFVDTSAMMVDEGTLQAVR